MLLHSKSAAFGKINVKTSEASLRVCRVTNPIAPFVGDTVSLTTSKIKPKSSYLLPKTNWTWLWLKKTLDFDINKRLFKAIGDFKAGVIIWEQDNEPYLETKLPKIIKIISPSVNFTANFLSPSR